MRRYLSVFALLFVQFATAEIQRTMVPASWLDDGARMERIEDPRPYLSVESAGYIINSADWAPDVRGYGGPIHILIHVDSAFVVQNVKILRHLETPDIAGGITKPSWLKQFRGKSLDDALEIEKDVDGITGATTSSKGVCRSIRRSLEAFSEAMAGAEKPGPLDVLKGWFSRDEPERDARAKSAQEAIRDGRLELTPARHYIKLKDQSHEERPSE